MVTFCAEHFWLPNQMVGWWLVDKNHGWCSSNLMLTKNIFLSQHLELKLWT